MKTQIRRFNEEGIEKFRDALYLIKDNQIDRIPETLLTDNYTCDIINVNVSIEQNLFISKEEIIKLIVDKLNNLNSKNLYYDKGLWSWLAAFYFDSICPRKNDEFRKIGDESRYILNPSEWNKYYRHLLASPSRLYNELGDISKIYLSGKPDIPGDLFEQLASRQEIAACKGIIEAATLLYWDSAEKKIKKGARNKDGAGVLRRFTTSTIPQFQRTYDLNSMSGTDILQLLPAEYDDWKIINSSKS